MVEATDNNLSSQEYAELYTLLIDEEHYLDALDVFEKNPFGFIPHKSVTSIDILAKGAIKESLNEYSDFYTAWSIQNRYIPDDLGSKYHISAKHAKYALDLYQTTSDDVCQRNTVNGRRQHRVLALTKELLLEYHNDVFNSHPLRYNNTSINIFAEISITDIERNVRMWIDDFSSLFSYHNFYISNEMYEHAQSTSENLREKLDTDLNLKL